MQYKYVDTMKKKLNYTTYCLIKFIGSVQKLWIILLLTLDRIGLSSETIVCFIF